MIRVLICAFVLCETLQIVVASIAGVTYMDHFDFEKRYRDVNQCNPFYWHPLHLPEECIQIFETLIRSRLKTLTPYRIMEEKSNMPEVSGLTYPYNYIYSPVYSIEFNSLIEYVEPTRRLSPFEKMFELLRRDVKDRPSAPSLQVSPYLGVIAMYKQPVSYKTVSMIKKLGRAYANSDYFSTIQSGIDNDSIEHNHETKVETVKDIINGTLVNNIIKNDDAIKLLKIKTIK